MLDALLSGNEGTRAKLSDDQIIDLLITLIYSGLSELLSSLRLEFLADVDDGNADSSACFTGLGGASAGCARRRRRRRDWILPSRQPDRTTVYKNRALRTPFVKLGHNSTLRIEIDDHVVQDNKW
ncbi:hypothetical protein ZEAMMB73_Zm00001d038967 [Zea mays]|uniref:Alpha-glucan water dikinase-like N-terminal Ig-like domain-containing protein n=1 Tax=Zea mays TaxID=4577 RepID=A0A1D6MC38_MAIZE|nr:hypothetical protein ZEAMMB73_Zm00001d026008 [Zea mays]AQK88319.1 hypothetical protein ZEAMMB73_Zm00001d038967 [Zea mays]